MTDTLFEEFGIEKKYSVYYCLCTNRGDKYYSKTDNRDTLLEAMSDSLKEGESYDTVFVIKEDVQSKVISRIKFVE